ncbi:MAG: hypothetical protein JWL70_1065, partial [Acidimicrobiia bacterium]|nr:hypothetical protein [Acidimicrobiia bacterium]
MDAEMIEMLRGSLRHVLTETTDRPLADRLADLGWDEVVADDEAVALLTLFEVKGDTRSPADALGPLLAGTSASAVGDASLAAAAVALPLSLNPLEPSSVVSGSELSVRGTLLVAPTDSTTLLVPVAGDDGIRLALVGSTKGFEFEAVAETDETQPWVTISG